MPRRGLEDMTGQLRKVIGLYKRAARMKYEQAVVEGPQAVREVLASRPGLIRDVYVTRAALVAHPDIDRLLKDRDPYTHILPADLFAEVTTTAQGFLAVVDIPEEEDLNAILETAQLVVLGVEMVDPGNLGTVIRTADATGADAVVLGHTSVEATNPKVIRSSAGSIFHTPVIEDEDVADVVQRARAAGMQILLADGGGDWDLSVVADATYESVLHGTTPDGPDLRKRTLWIVGNEAHGFTEEQRELADAVISVPIYGQAESLNVAMATSVCLYTSAIAQRRGE